MYRSEQHYRRMLAEHPRARVGLQLASQMVYAARHGTFSQDPWRQDAASNTYRSLYRSLESRYGQYLQREDVEREMDWAAQSAAEEPNDDEPDPLVP